MYEATEDGGEGKQAPLLMIAARGVLIPHRKVWGGDVPDERLPKGPRYVEQLVEGMISVRK